MKRLVLKVLIALLLIVPTVELLSCIFVTVLNVIAYGKNIEIVKVEYDPYAIYVQKGGPVPTGGSRPSPVYDRNREVWLFGGSTMLTSTSQTAGTTLASVVAGKLTAKDTVNGYNVLNFGVYGFNSLLESKYLEKCLIEQPVKPDVVVFYDGINDANYFMQYKEPYGHYSMDKMSGIINANASRWLSMLRPFISYYYSSYTRDLIHKLTMGAEPIDAADPKLKEYVDKTEQRYDQMDAMCRFMGIPFVLVWQPMRWIETCDVPESVSSVENRRFNGKTLSLFRSNYSLVNTALAERLQGKPYFVDIRDALCGRTQPVYWDDGVHIHDEGNAMVADRIVPIVMQRLDARKKAVAATTLVDVLADAGQGQSGDAKQSSVRFEGFDPGHVVNGNPFRLAPGPKAVVSFEAPNAGRMILTCAFYSQTESQRLDVSLNGRRVDHVLLSGPEFHSRYLPIDVVKGRNELVFDVTAPGISFVSLLVHGYPD